MRPTLTETVRIQQIMPPRLVKNGATAQDVICVTEDGDDVTIKFGTYAKEGQPLKLAGFKNGDVVDVTYYVKSNKSNKSDSYFNDISIWSIKRHETDTSDDYEDEPDEDPVPGVDVSAQDDEEMPF